MPDEPIFGVIGGSGLYAMPGLQDVVSHDIETPFGKPSTPVVVGRLEGQPVAFISRHGEGHVYSPSEVNYRANIYALKSLGIERVVAVSACGSLREDYGPGHMVIPDQLFDFTKNRDYSFFGQGLVAHIGVADPFCGDFSDKLLAATRETGDPVHRGGAYITIEGPRFSTRAESNTFRSWGMSIVGMTTSPEAFLAKEAEMCYAVMAHVTDYDVWHLTEEPVSAEMVFKIVNANLATAQEAIRNMARNFNPKRDCDCEDTLRAALTTQKGHVPEATLGKLALLVEKYLK